MTVHIVDIVVFRRPFLNPSNRCGCVVSLWRMYVAFQMRSWREESSAWLLTQILWRSRCHAKTMWAVWKYVNKPDTAPELRLASFWSNSLLKKPNTYYRKWDENREKMGDIKNEMKTKNRKLSLWTFKSFKGNYHYERLKIYLTRNWLVKHK